MDRLKEIETRKNEIKKELETTEDKSKLEKLSKEVDDLLAEERNLKGVEERKAITKKLEENSIVANDIDAEMRMVSANVEVRNTSKYIDAYAEYLKTKDDTEVRSLLTDNATGGTVAVPTFVSDIVKTSREKSSLASLATYSEIKGNFEQQFEYAGSDATDHTEGAADNEGGNISLGIVKLIPGYVNKMISISKEVMSLRGTAFLNYIYDAITHKIFLKLDDKIVAKVLALPATPTSESPSANAITVDPSSKAVVDAVCNLSDEANKPVLIMNKLTYSYFKDVERKSNYNFDIFEGYDVKYSSKLPAYEKATAGAVYMIAGDISNGVQLNFPNGIDNIEFIFDTLTPKKKSLVEISGDSYVAADVVADKAFCLVKKPAASK